MSFKILAVLSVLFLAAKSIDMRVNQSLYILTVQMSENSLIDIQDSGNCLVNSTWVNGTNGAKDAIIFTPVDGWCIQEAQRRCEVQSFVEFFVNDPASIVVMEEWAKFIPDLSRDFIPLKCPAKEEKIDHVLFINGRVGYTAIIWEGSQSSGFLGGNRTENVSSQALNFRGSVIAPVNMSTDYCPVNAISGEIRFYNHLHFQNLPYSGTVDIFVSNLTVSGQSYANITLGCFYGWEGAIQVEIFCSSPLINSQNSISFTNFELTDNFVIMMYQSFNQQTYDVNSCTYIFKARAWEDESEEVLQVSA